MFPSPSPTGAMGWCRSSTGPFVEGYWLGSPLLWPTHTVLVHLSTIFLHQKKMHRNVESYPYLFGSIFFNDISSVVFLRLQRQHWFDVLMLFYKAHNRIRSPFPEWLLALMHYQLCYAHFLQHFRGNCFKQQSCNLWHPSHQLPQFACKLQKVRGYFSSWTSPCKKEKKTCRCTIKSLPTHFQLVPQLPSLSTCCSSFSPDPSLWQRHQASRLFLITPLLSVLKRSLFPIRFPMCWAHLQDNLLNTSMYCSLMGEINGSALPLSHVLLLSTTKQSVHTLLEKRSTYTS